MSLGLHRNVGLNTDCNTADPTLLHSVILVRKFRIIGFGNRIFFLTKHLYWKLEILFEPSIGIRNTFINNYDLTATN